MRMLEAKYLGLYKQVEAVCVERLSGKYGVTEYITHMENAGNEKARVPGWDVAYKKLKHLRWIRTKIAHETGDSECSKEDYRDLKAFQKLLKRKKDPLSLLQQVKSGKKVKMPRGALGQKQSGGAAKVLVGVLVVAVLAVAAFLLFKFLR